MIFDMKYTFLLFMVLATSAYAQPVMHDAIDLAAQQVTNDVVKWRRDFHQNPELSNREYETSKKVAAHLRSLGIEVETGVAHTGVIGYLKGAQSGPTIGLRADMDALPVEERVDLPFASKAKGEYLGEEVSVMHACGHDAHTAILMGAATVLSQIKDQLKGNVVFIFQPAEEGAPPGEKGGAKLIVEEGIMKKYDIKSVFGLHIRSSLPHDQIAYRPRGYYAAADIFNITINGKQAHGAAPWSGVDPIVTGAQIIMGLQTIISRNSNLTKGAAVITVGKMTSGVRNNIIPQQAHMTGTIRALDMSTRDRIHKRVEEIATNIGKAHNAEVEVEIIKGTPVTYNHPELSAKMINTLYDVAGEEKVQVVPAVTAGEDFAFYAEEVPCMFFTLGGKDPEASYDRAPSHHSPDFRISEQGFELGVRVMSRMAADYLSINPDIKY